MLLIRKLAPLMRKNNTRQLAKKSLKPNKMEKLISGATPSNKQVHQETFRYISPFPRINIRSDIYLRIKAADVHEYPDANVLIAELHGGHVRNCPVALQVNVSEDERLINIDINKISNAPDFHCNLEIPIRSDLHVEAQDSVTVSNILSSEVKVKANKNIDIKEVRADSVTLESAEGNIRCKGMLLGRVTRVETSKEGNMSFEKLQGDQLSCKTDGGNISTNSCYVEESRFVTNSGTLTLKNVHKKTEVDVQKGGTLNMTGVHGNLKVRANGGKVSLQLSELKDENFVKANDVEQVLINISDLIEEQSKIEVISSGIVLDDTLCHLNHGTSQNNTIFRNCNTAEAQSNLIVESNGEVKLGKLSWVESLREQLDAAGKSK
ncbi:protein FAM185A [Eurosta solidaginis]|uniref:protein FAM185A n=1 Tax=Eurosta solidaginis TaxID=178769 RepID=UPI0035312B63